MAQGAPKMLQLGVLVVVLLVAALVAEGAPPGLAKEPNRVKCLNTKYKECYNLEHVCPKFCPDSCTVDCRSCRPICAADSPPPPYTPQPTPSPPPPPTPSPPTPPTPSSPSPPPTPITPQTPSPSTSSQKRVRCRNQSYTKCYGQEHVCPANCPTTCEVDCVTCKPVCMCQDPRFIGGDGITFYFHGKKENDFCLVTDPDLHINAHFIGKRSPRMTRDFTWVQSLGILYGPHRLFVGARKTATWDDSVDRLALAFDNEPVFLEETEGATWRSATSSPALTVTRTAGAANGVSLELEGKFRITAKVVPITRKDSDVHNYGITTDDCFAHLDIGFKFYSLTADVEGVLGKTYREDYVSKVKVGAPMPVVGGEREYQTTGLFAADCKAARFVAGRGLEGQSVVLKDQTETLMNCASGMNGAGVVCKR
ncbi:hypothetical protein V2J09_018373 [Rumex salicifolius]